MTRRRVAVIGAGVTGLAAGWHLRDDADVVVLDAADRPGGQIMTIDLAGTALDVGADAFLVRRPEAEDLVRAVGFGDDDLVEPATGQVWLWVRGRLRPLPPGTVLGAPGDLRKLATSGVLSPAGLARAAIEPLLPRRKVVGDRSVSDLVGERFGHEVVDTLVEPLLGGVYAGAADRLSAQAAAPPIWAAARSHRSLLVGLAAHRRTTAGDPRPIFRTLRGGLSRLVDKLTHDLGDRVRTGAGVSSLERTGEGRWALSVGSGADAPSREVVDDVILAVPAAAAAALLAPTVPDVARELAGIRVASVGVVALSYAREDAAEVPEGSGFLVPRGEGRLVKAVTVSSRKWPHHARTDRFMLRASVGRVDDPRALDLDDATLAERVDEEVRLALGLRGPARDRAVVRWEHALPQYDVGHEARVDRILHGVANQAGLHVGGASLTGVGLPARAADATRLAAEIRDRVTERRPSRR